jgi:hypothetical protein
MPGRLNVLITRMKSAEKFFGLNLSRSMASGVNPGREQFNYTGQSVTYLYKKRLGGRSWKISGRMRAIPPTGFSKK